MFDTQKALGNLLEQTERDLRWERENRTRLVEEMSRTGELFRRSLGLLEAWQDGQSPTAQTKELLAAAVEYYRELDGAV